LLATLAAEV